MEPIILICFDRNLNLLARFMYCDRDQYTATQIAYLMSHNRQQLHLQDELATSNSIETGDTFHCGALHGSHTLVTNNQSPTILTGPCCHCAHVPPGETTPLRPQAQYRLCSQSSEAPLSSSTSELRGFRDFSPQVENTNVIEMSFTPLRVEYDPIRSKEEQADMQDDVQC